MADLSCYRPWRTEVRLVHSSSRTPSLLRLISLSNMGMVVSISLSCRCVQTLTFDAGTRTGCLPSRTTPLLSMPAASLELPMDMKQHFGRFSNVSLVRTLIRCRMRALPSRPRQTTASGASCRSLMGSLFKTYLLGNWSRDGSTGKDC